MYYSEFRNKVIEHLSRNNKQGKDVSFRGHLYKHILDYSKDNKKEEVIKQYLLLHDTDKYSFLFGKGKAKLHRDAHHLNSSQMVCYNFFRPIIENKKLMSGICSDIIGRELGFKDVTSDFEYLEKNGESTNFDFHVKCENVEIYFEIKYTEQNFGPKSNADNPEEQYDRIYRNMFKSSSIAWKTDIDPSDFNLKYYQLFRNALRATDNDKYIIFLCPGDHSNLRKKFCEFADKYLSEWGKIHILYITWEEIINCASKRGYDISKFQDFYFGY